MASARLPGLKRHIGGMLKVCPIALNMNTRYTNTFYDTDTVHQYPYGRTVSLSHAAIYDSITVSYRICIYTQHMTCTSTVRTVPYED